MYKINLLPGSFGDALLVRYGKSDNLKYILIDGGPVHNFDDFHRALKEVAPDMKEIELMVITHIDIDHIDGLVKLLNTDQPEYKIKEIWFNGREQLLQAADQLDQLGALQGEYLTQLIIKHNIPLNQSFENGIAALDADGAIKEITLDGGMKITLLAPGLKELKKLLPKWDEEINDKGDGPVANDHRYDRDDLLGDWIEAEAELPDGSDASLPNRSSLAFIAEYNGKSCLFAGDTPGKVLTEGIDTYLEMIGDEHLKLDYWKLAHHGSKGSTSTTVIDKIIAKHILVSTNGKRYKHPDKGPLAKILFRKSKDHIITLHFNYQTEFNEMWDDAKLKAKYKYDSEYGDDNGICVGD